MIYRLAVPLALLAVLILIVTLSAGPRESAAPALTPGPLHDPGYSARDAHLVQTGADGRPVYTLDAAQIRQQPNQGTVQLEQVRLAFRDTTGNQWTARADRGQLTQQSGVVDLAGDVQVAGLVPGSGGAAQISTDQLAFDTGAQIITTHDPVTVFMSGRLLSARGLVANLKERRVRLESHVHGSFLP